MTGLGQLRLPDRPLQVLCIGAHSDDLEIGCGGTLLRLAAAGHQLYWVVLSAIGPRASEARKGAGRFGVSSDALHICEFRDGFFPYEATKIKEWFESIKPELDPDLIFTHRRDDLHQDHRLVNELTWNTFRNHLILEYEIPKYDGDFGPVNCFVPLDRDDVMRKVELIKSTFASQARRQWFDEEIFMGLMRLRGMESRSPSGFAEGFHARKMVLSLDTV